MGVDSSGKGYDAVATTNERKLWSGDRAPRGWSLTGNLSEFYEPVIHLREYELKPRPAFNKIYSFYPYLWTKEAKIGTPNTCVIDADEGLRFRVELCGFQINEP